jgi:hypothetical protein
MRPHNHRPFSSALLRSCVVTCALLVLGTALQAGPIANLADDDVTVIINPRIQVRVSPTYLVQGIAQPAMVTVMDEMGAGIPNATVELTNGLDSSVRLGIGITGPGGRATIALTPPGPAEVAAGVRVWVRSSVGSTNGVMISVRPTAACFVVQEVRIIDPPEGTRLGVVQGSKVPFRAVIRGIGTGSISGFWTLNGVPLVPFTATMTAGSLVEVKSATAMVKLDSLFRLGPNVVTLRVMAPNRVESRDALVDVSAPPRPKAPETTTGAAPAPKPAVVSAPKGPLEIAKDPAWSTSFALLDPQGSAAVSFASLQSPRQSAVPKSSLRFAEAETGGAGATPAPTQPPAQEKPGEKPLTLALVSPSSVTISGRVSGDSDAQIYETSTPRTAADASFSTSADMVLSGNVSHNVALDVRTNLVASTESISLGDLRTKIVLGQTAVTAGRAALDSYNPYTAQSLASREVLTVAPNVDSPSWHLFGLRTDSGASGGVGAEDRFDRYGYGGRMALHFGGLKAELSAVQVQDDRDITPTPGSFATPQSSRALALSVGGPLGKSATQLAAEVGWSWYDPNRNASGDSVNGLAYDLSVGGQRGVWSWSTRAFDIPTDFYTLGNPFLRRGYDGWESSVGTSAGGNLAFSLTYSDRSEDFLSGGFESLTTVPATDVSDLTAALTWNGEARGLPTVAVTGIWGSRDNGGVGDARIDQSERTLSTSLTKTWGPTTAGVSWATYDLSDRTGAGSSVATDQWAVTASHTLSPVSAVTATYSDYSSDLGTTSQVDTKLWALSYATPLAKWLQSELSYTRTTQSDTGAGFDGRFEEYRLRLGYRPPEKPSLWQQVLSALSLEGRLMYQKDPNLSTGEVRRSELRLTASTSF